MTQPAAMFEAPAAQAAHYSNPYSNPEFEDEWETSPAAHYSNPEFETSPAAHYSNPYSNPEWESPAAQYNNPYSNPEFENEWENPVAHYSNPYSNPEFENEWESPVAHYSNPYSNPEFENEWESPAAHYSNPYSNPEFENEGEYFWGGLKKIARKAWKVAAPFAKGLAPKLVSTLFGMIPGAGAIAGPLAGKLTSALLKEAEMEAMQMEAEFFGTNEAEAEVANHEMAHEAALTEFLAAQAAEATTEAESGAAIAATLPITIRIMGGRRALRHVTPILTQATGRMSRMLSQQGPIGNDLKRVMPTIERQTVALLKAASRAGQPINNTTAIRALASATNRVLSNPRRVQRAIVRNNVIQNSTARPNSSRMATAAAHSCPTCSTPMRMIRR
jgi:hypothetical protein